MGAFLNVRINAKQLEDEGARQEYLERGAALQDEARRREREVLALVEGRLESG